MLIQPKVFERSLLSALMVDVGHIGVWRGRSAFVVTTFDDAMPESLGCSDFFSEFLSLSLCEECMKVSFAGFLGWGRIRTKFSTENDETVGERNKKTINLFMWKWYG